MEKLKVKEKRAKILIVLLLHCFIANSLFAAFSKVGLTAVPFLKISVGRASGMGDAFSAIADDASATYYNPAGLGNLTKREVLLNHIDWIADVNHDYGSLILPITNLGTVGFSVTALTMGDMEQTILDNQATTVREDSGTGLMFGAADFAFGLSYGRLITDKLSFGFTVKAVSSNIWDMNQSGAAFDLGLLYNTGFKSLRLGAVIANYGAELAYKGRQLDFADTTQKSRPPATLKTTPAPLPTVFRFGIGYNLIETKTNILTLAVDLTHPNDINETVNFGLEYNMSDLFFLRGGYILNTDGSYAQELGRNTGISAGTGIIFKPNPGLRLNINYGFRWMGVLKATHRVILNIGF